MRTRLTGFTATVAAVAATAGCGLTGEEPREPSQQSGSITVGDKTRQTKSVDCSQNEWALTIDADAHPARAHVLLQLGGEKPLVRSVNIENIDGLGGVSGSGVGKAEARLQNSSVYTITGTARVTRAADPAQTTDMPFSIEAPC
jgi:lipoprotein LpqH